MADCGLWISDGRLRVAELSVRVSAQPPLESGPALFANQEPQLQCSEPASEWNAPVAVVLHAAVRGRLEVARVRGHHADQMFRVTHVVERAVERRAEPLVRVDDE